MRFQLTPGTANKLERKRSRKRPLGAWPRLTARQAPLQHGQVQGQQREGRRRRALEQDGKTIVAQGPLLHPPQGIFVCRKQSGFLECAVYVGPGRRTAETLVKELQRIIKERRAGCSL